MINEKNKRLIERLLERTDEGKVEWKEAADRGFQLSFAQNSINLRQATSRNGTIYIVSLLNALGEVADSFNDEDLDADGDGPDSTWFSKLKQLYTQAQRQARGADKVLNEILSELDDDIPF